MEARRSAAGKRGSSSAIAASSQSHGHQREVPSKQQQQRQRQQRRRKFQNPHAVFREDMIAKKKEIVVHRYKKMLRKMGQGPLQSQVTTQVPRMTKPGKGPWMGPTQQAGKGAPEESQLSPSVEKPDYPEHLRHLYEAEEKALSVAEPETIRVRKKKLNSYQKAKQEFERLNEEKTKKAEEIKRRKEEREKAIKEHKQRKLETFRMLSQKTKKGQPRLQLQMEQLLVKIQANQGGTQ